MSEKREDRKGTWQETEAKQAPATARGALPAEAPKRCAIPSQESSLRAVGRAAGRNDLY